MYESNRVLLINDEEQISVFLREKLIVSGGYMVTVEPSAKAGIETFKRGGFDLVIMQFEMADMPGLSLIRQLKEIEADCIIIVLINDFDEHLVKEISRAGGYDYLKKPVNIEKLLFLVKKGTELHGLVSAHHKLSQSFKEQNLSLQKQNTLLAKRIEESTKNLTRLYEDLRNTYMRTIKVLAHAIDARDHYTHSHSENVATYAVMIAEEMRLPAEQVQLIREACELHDLGKIGVEDSILSKPSSLDEKEWENMKKHPMIGAQILEPLSFLDGVIDLIKQHHEHFDGSGYPQGLKGEEILLGARILKIADAYEAMRSARSYRKTPLTKEQAVGEIKKNSGIQFDPKVVEAFLRVVDKLP